MEVGVSGVWGLSFGGWVLLAPCRLSSALGLFLVSPFPEATRLSEQQHRTAAGSPQGLNPKVGFLPSGMCACAFCTPLVAGWVPQGRAGGTGSAGCGCRSRLQRCCQLKSVLQGSVCSSTLCRPCCNASSLTALLLLEGCRPVIRGNAHRACSAETPCA